MVAPWKQLESEHELEKLLENSTKKPVVIFKHSTRCGVSSHAMHRLENEWQLDDKELDFYYLDLLSYRNISNEIAERLGVIHQSPQIIVIKNGRAAYDISHQGISVTAIKKALEL